MLSTKTTLKKDTKANFNMSLFLALTLKSSKKSEFLWKGVLDPRKHVWEDFKISKDMHVSSQDTALAYDSPLFQESLSARLL